MKLGKLPPKHDPRTLMLADVLRAPAPPAYWSYDLTYPRLSPVPTPLWGNDRLGDCVVVSQGHLQMRFEGAEHGRLPTITEDDIVREYMRQSGGQDTGLYMLDAAKEWRTHGLVVGGKPERIKAFAQINPHDTRTLKAACAARLGLWVGAELPINSGDMFALGQLWRVMTTSGEGAPGSLGGHAMSVVQFSPSRWWLGTWGKVQPCTMAWFKTYVSEVYAVIDSLDNKALDGDAIYDYLKDKAVA